MNALISIYLAALLLRCCIGLGPFSGMGKPPMFGDFEAQRHWMEIALNLPTNEWYVGKHELNDLQYWGLDYPPLTAYHSLAFAFILNKTTPETVAFGTSRGIESSSTKVWMRFSALLSDAITFIPAVIWYYYRKLQLQKPNETSREHFIYAATFLALTSPSFMLIDHGHFQFNCVAHGFVVISLCLLQQQSSGEISLTSACLASIAFCLALNFKQMSLFYSPAIFTYLLHWTMNNGELRTFLVRFVALGLTVIGTFGLIWFPFFMNGTALQVLHRVFPFERGLFEDKVSNFWCASNVFIKWKSTFSRDMLTIFAFGLTFLGIIPSCITLFVKSTERRRRPSLNLIMFTTSLSFFLFSFQVHEKNILIPLVPAVLCFGDGLTLCSSIDRDDSLRNMMRNDENSHVSCRGTFLGFWFSIFASLSMIPLLVKDGLMTTTMFSLGFFVLAEIILVGEEVDGDTINSNFLFDMSLKSLLAWIGSISLLTTSYLICYHQPPPQLPDLFIVIHIFFSFIVFFLFWIYGNFLLWEDVLYSTFSTNTTTKEKKSKRD